MSLPSLNNFKAFEGTISSETTLTFPWKPRKVIITNDSASNELSFKLNSSESYGTLNPTETLALETHSKTLIINGTSVAYRIWGFG